MRGPDVFMPVRSRSATSPTFSGPIVVGGAPVELGAIGISVRMVGMRRLLPTTAEESLVP